MRLTYMKFYTNYLLLHRNQRRKDKPRTVHETNVMIKEHRLEVLCLYMRPLLVPDSSVSSRIHTFPGVLEALTLCVPNSAFRSEDFPTFGCPTRPKVKKLAGLNDPDSAEGVSISVSASRFPSSEGSDFTSAGGIASALQSQLMLTFTRGCH